MSEKCNYCNKIFTNKYILQNHQKTAKYCLQLRLDSTTNSDIVCQYCSKTFTKKFSLDKHEIKCLYSKENTDRLIKENQELKNQNKYLTKLIQDRNISLEKSENRIQELALTAINKPTKNTIINNNLIPLTYTWLENQSDYLTTNDIQDGVSGYAAFAANKSLKDRVQISDISRNIFQYKNEEGKKIKEKGHGLTKMFFESIKDKHNLLSNELTENLWKQITETKNKSEFDLLFNMYKEYKENVYGINTICKGQEHKLTEDFIKELSKRLPKTT